MGKGKREEEVAYEERLISGWALICPSPRDYWSCMPLVNSAVAGIIRRALLIGGALRNAQGLGGLANGIYKIPSSSSSSSSSLSSSSSSSSPSSSSSSSSCYHHHHVIIIISFIIIVMTSGLIYTLSGHLSHTQAFSSNHMTPDISVILPTYNERQNLPLVIWLLVKHMTEG